MPLKSVEWRADPVLYKENLPPNIQVYSDIGNNSHNLIFRKHKNIKIAHFSGFITQQIYL